MDLWSADWKIKAGHRIGIKVADANGDWWIHAPTQQTVTVYGGEVSLPFLSFKRTGQIQGDPGVQLASYLAKKVTVPADTIKSGESSSFGLPPAMKAAKR